MAKTAKKTGSKRPSIIREDSNVKNTNGQALVGVVCFHKLRAIGEGGRNRIADWLENKAAELRGAEGAEKWSPTFTGRFYVNNPKPAKKVAKKAKAAA